MHTTRCKCCVILFCALYTYWAYAIIACAFDPNKMLPSVCACVCVGFDYWYEMHPWINCIQNWKKCDAKNMYPQPHNFFYMDAIFIRLPFSPCHHCLTRPRSYLLPLLYSDSTLWNAFIALAFSIHLLQFSHRLLYIFHYYYKNAQKIHKSSQFITTDVFQNETTQTLPRLFRFHLTVYSVVVLLLGDWKFRSTVSYSCLNFRKFFFSSLCKYRNVLIL